MTYAFVLAKMQLKILFFIFTKILR